MAALLFDWKASHMNVFGKTSMERLLTCNAVQQAIHMTAIPNAPYDYGIACGHRSNAQQQIEYDEGDSNAKPGESGHNHETPSGEPDSLDTDIYIYHGGEYLYGDESPEARAMMIETQRYLQGVAQGMGYDLDVMPTFRRGGKLVEDLGHNGLKG